MSDPKNISPLLDGFTLGAPISEHHGVVCCPAIKENTTKKYIVKIISVPASQTQFDALLLAGAYKDPGDAMEYFRENGEYIMEEAELLKSLSKIEGFLPYDGWQMEPITRRRLGYEIYLLGSYKRSLDKYIRKNAFTHLEAINLALDLCSALSVCRQAGFLYADLKPSNIYVSEKKEYRIGDLGFLSMDALRYVSLPERYFSPYTPPELLDPMVPMNLTVDTYAVGMILYQLYNDGQLPCTVVPPLDSLPSPCNADYEMAEIIMKAIHPDPEQRWTDPKDLGKAIATYMQRNRVNDIPITPFIPLDVNPEDIVPVSSKRKHDDDNDTVCLTEEKSPAEAEQLPEPEESAQDNNSVDSESSINDEQSLQEETDITEEDSSTVSEGMDKLNDSENETEDSQMQDHPSEDSSAPDQEEDSNPFIEISEETARILSRANDIIAHEIPEETAFPEEESQPDPFAFALEESEDRDDIFPADPLMDEPLQEDIPVKKKKSRKFQDNSQRKKFKKFISVLFAVILLCGLSFCGFWYYQNIYLRNIDSISITGTQDQITVLVDTSIEESSLCIHCTDENGNRKTESVRGGKVVFSNLKPSTQYTIQVDMTGFHKLVGKTSDVFTTDSPTQILAFSAIAGSEDGSVMLDFTVNGAEPNFWNIRYLAEGEEERLETVTSHSAMITGLTVGKVYTFTLDGGKNFDLGGETSIQYLASKLILAENLAVTSSNGSDITVNWNTPGDVVVENWNVRCYDGYGFEEQVTVTGNTALFTGIDSGSKYTVEVTAAGMTQPSRISISSDPIHVSGFQMDESPQTEMKITWEYTGNDPEGGWLLLYTVDGSGSQVIQCPKATAKIAPFIPGANYEFVLQSADNRTVFNNVVQYQTKEADDFSEYNFTLEDVSFDFLKTPDESNWRYETIGSDVFTNQFQPGDSASMVLRSSSSFYLPGNKTKLLFVFRDSYWNVLPELVTEVSKTWKNIWLGGDSRTGEIDIPNLPATPGTYLMELYFDGCFVGQFDIIISE